MEEKHKDSYQTPTAEVVEVRIESCILDVSGYDNVQRDIYGDADEI